ncbi:hypothetical protein J4223_02960 [Candidatus Woesearchaeota archaeon]|nr:hypothetical protein [Candidatus Woesearchaeota archaeon]
MGKEDNILVVDKDCLFAEHSEFFGFIPHGNYDFESRILNPDNYRFTRRGTPDEDPSVSAEANTVLKQPIRYVVIVNSNMKKVFAYKRISMDEDPNKIESRLAGKWSWGVGGHIEECDTEGNFIHNSMIREISEEVEFVNGSIQKVSPLGYINDSDFVGRVHFGLLYLIETDASEVKPISEASAGRFHSLKELETILENHDCVVEGWSKIALEPLKEYFERLN